MSTLALKKRRLTRHPGVMGVLNVIASGFLGLVWMWFPLLLLFSGLGSTTAFGIGIFILIPWFYLQRLANWLERYRSEAVYGLQLYVPHIKRSDESGAWGFVLNQVYHLFSSAFWRATAVHYLKMVLGLLTGLFWGVFIVAGIALAVIAFNKDVLTIFLGMDSSRTWPTPWFVVVSVALILLSFTILWFSAYPDKALDRALLGVARTEALAEQLSISNRARVGAIDAATNERLRIERDLHDGVQPTLVALSMKIGMAKARLATDPDGARELIAEAHADSKAAIEELRQTVRGFHPAVLEDRGLDAAVSALAARSVIPVDIHVNVSHTLSKEVEAVAYFVVAESITNANKHSQASAITVNINTATYADQLEPVLTITVADNGTGGARVQHGGTSTGLAGLAARVASARGTLTVSSPVGGPTLISVELPCA